MEVWFAITSLATFVLTLFALVLAIQLYALLRTGTVGGTWRIIVGATALFGMGEILRFAGVWGFLDSLSSHVAAQIANFLFAALLAWALWIQRQAFYRPEVYRFTPHHQRKGYPSRYERRSPEESGTSRLPDTLLSDADDAELPDD